MYGMWEVGVGVKVGPKRFEHVCRNGHRRTEENTYIRKDGARQCKDCPGFQRKQLSTKQRRLLDSGLRELPRVPSNGTPDPCRPRRSRAHGAAGRPAQPRTAPTPKQVRDTTSGPIYHRVLSPEQLDYLRSLIPCAGCGAPFGAAHDARCLVPYNRENDGAEPSRNTRAAA